jgi:hypothetical protein
MWPSSVSAWCGGHEMSSVQQHIALMVAHHRTKFFASFCHLAVVLLLRYICLDGSGGKDDAENQEMEVQLTRM